jgi:hypothetical protein
MENEFIPYKQALALKELGFDEHCFAHYCNGDLITKTAILKSSTMLYYQQNNINPNNQYKHQNCTAPLYQQAFRWFRKKYNLKSFIQPLINDDDIDIYVFAYGNGEIEHDDYDYLTHEEAELACLIKLIEITKTK